MPELTDLRAICPALEYFALPAALGSLKDNAFVFWNESFQRRSGLSDVELVQAPLTSLILLEDTYSGPVLENSDPENVVRFVPCVLKGRLLNEWVAGRALRRSDGMLLAILDLSVGDVAFEGFIHGRLVGQEEEKERTKQFFHDILSAKILVATFTAREIYQTLAAGGAEGAKELARVTKLLQEVTEDISNFFEAPKIQAEPIPGWPPEAIDRS